MKAESDKRFFNRELSWLFFNSRVLEEAQNPDVPLLERVRFLSISASNLDEFYMVRVAGLRTQVLAGMTEPSFDGHMPARQLEKIAKRVRKIKKAQGQSWRDLRKSLMKENICVKTVEQLNEAEREELALYYAQNILPLLTPITVDPAHPFPHIPNLGFGMVLGLKRKERKEALHALLPVPSHVPRFIALGKKQRDYVMVEDVLKHFSSSLFPDFSVTEQGVFRVTPG
jgi:polyphosphate kinase